MSRFFCLLALTLTGCASFGVFKTTGEKQTVCLITDSVLTELQALAAAWGVDLSLLVKEWSSACANAAVSHANYSEKALSDLALKSVRTKAMELSKGNEKLNMCKPDAKCL